MFLNILVAFDRSSAARRALEQAIDLARAQHSLLTLITVAPPAASTVIYAGVKPETMRQELDEWAAGVLAEGVALLPDELSAHTVQRRGEVGSEIVKELESGGYDLIVLGSRARGRAKEGLLGSVNGYVHFHSRVPILSVPSQRN